MTVTANAVRIADDPEQWEADSHTFWETEGDINLDDVVAHPEEYLCYLTVSTRRGAKEQAQGMLDKFRDGYPVVPVPSYRADAAICNRPADQIKLLGGMQMGGLPVYELASGEIVSLSLDDLKAIMRDVAAAEVEMQLAKQTCWNEIDGATSYEEITASLANFDATMEKYRKK